MSPDLTTGNAPALVIIAVAYIGAAALLGGIGIGCWIVQVWKERKR